MNHIGRLFTYAATGALAITISGISARAGGPLIWIDAPLAYSTVSGPVTVTGWAIDSTAAINPTSVTVEVDNIPVGTAQYGIARPDVCLNYPDWAGCPAANVGFLYSWNTALIAPGNHVLRVSATDVYGGTAASSTSVPVTVAPARPSVWIDEPVANEVIKNNLIVSGWAIDNIYSAIATSPIFRVQLFIDGAYAGPVDYGISRPAVCLAYPGRAGCPNVGFWSKFNINNLGEGIHVITVQVTDENPAPYNTGSASVVITKSRSGSQ
jgi:hypothetical protein